HCIIDSAAPVRSLHSFPTRRSSDLVLIDAHQQGKLGKYREHLATRAAILQHGFATVGIIALVDEATGYQDFRQRDALAKILERLDRKSTRLNSSHLVISYAVFCLKK